MHSISSLLLLSVLPLTLIQFGTWQASFSPRMLFVFLCSFSFQSNFIGWLYLLGSAFFPKQVRFWKPLQAASVSYLTIVIIVWAVELGGREDNLPEWIFNSLLHYVAPATVLGRWVYERRHRMYIGVPWPNPAFVLIYPMAYLAFLQVLDAYLGYSVYPFLEEYLMTVILAFGISACGWNIFNRINV